MKILVWIQPTGNLHIGNYFWVIEPAIKLQKDNEVIFLVANYHANTNSYDTAKMIVQLEKLWAKTVTYQKPEVLELFYELSHTEMVKDLERLPQYNTKEKTLHMLSYPLLMACDIILSECDAVLVWEDQMPHMYYYHDIARQLKKPPAKEIVIPDRQIKSIRNPDKKMSKSLWEEHCIYLTDDYNTIYHKIKKAPTTQEGIMNFKTLADIVWVEYDELDNALSKEILATAIYNKLK